MTLDQFKDKYLALGKVEYHSFGGADTYNQCVDLANQYIVEVLGYTPIIGTHAKDFPTKYDKSQFDWIPNNPNDSLFPKSGDVTVWTDKVGGGAGHIAIVLDSTTARFTSLDQNWSQRQKITIENHSYSNVSGWLHPKGVVENMDALQECLAQHKKLVDETVELKKIIETLKSEEAAYKVDVDNMKLAFEENIKKLKVELEGKLLLETQVQQERDGRRDDALKFEMKRLEWEGAMEKIKQQMASDDLSLRDYEVLVKALIKKIQRDIQSLRK